MACCSCKRRSAAPGQSSVTEEAHTETPPEPTPMERDGHVVASLPGVRGVTIEFDELVAHADRDGLPQLMTTLRDDPRFAFEQLMDLCGVDFPQRPERFDVVYNLLSVSRNRRLRVIVTTDAETPVASVHEIWPCATWWEREAWDLYGIIFSGQPDLRRILTDYGFEGHPMRKDFPLTGYVEVRYDEERKAVVYEPVSLTQDFRNFDFLSPWEAITTLPGDEKVHAARAKD
jgi:NADH-quinone oxidoreductase subunit C